MPKHPRLVPIALRRPTARAFSRKHHPAGARAMTDGELYAMVREDDRLEFERALLDEFMRGRLITAPDPRVDDEIARLKTAMHDAFMAMCAHRDKPDDELFQDAIDALGIAVSDERPSERGNP